MRRKQLPPRPRVISQKENLEANRRLKAEALAAKKAVRAAERAERLAAKAAPEAPEEPVVEEAPEEPVVEEAPEPMVEEAPEAPVVEEEKSVDLSVLDNSIGDLNKALETGAHDADLVELISAEKEGKNRKGAVQALRARLSSLG